MSNKFCTVKRIYCCGCGMDVDAVLTDGGEVYPHLPHLRSLPFWRCNACGNFVGCHRKTKNRIEPLGCIQTAELKEARKKFHALIRPLLQSGKISRYELYAAISRELGWEYHTAKTRTMDEARAAYRAARKCALT